jgi:hypothetical protein
MKVAEIIQAKPMPFEIGALRYNFGLSIDI